MKPRRSAIWSFLLLASCDRKQEIPWEKELVEKYRPRVEERLARLKRIAEKLPAIATEEPSPISLGERPGIKYGISGFGTSKSPNARPLVRCELQQICGLPSASEWILWDFVVRSNHSWWAIHAKRAITEENPDQLGAHTFPEFLEVRYLVLLAQREYAEPELTLQAGGPVLFKPATYAGRIYLFDLTDESYLGCAEIVVTNDSKMDFHYQRSDHLNDESIRKAAMERLLGNLEMELEHAIEKALKPYAPDDW